MDSTRGMNIDQYKLVEVNHTKKYPKYDPFVLSYQANQVYYAPYPSLKRDKAQRWEVFKTKARSVVDAPVDEDFLQETSADIPTLCAPDDVPDYEGDEDGFGDSDTENEVLPDAPPDESSFKSTDSEDEDEDDGFWDDDTDDDLSADGEDDSTEI
ncbi:pheromone-processing carboxypeptidase KEX1-like [Chenopodium quinoa]|uniref:pheromone-processing carboxypeptidase KEX1-like n=1 Tax=Chenopodium quinoa TaxID=63459 RepID=UPI000B787D73|nr:pheromone-processing carboxypeptidase KEX1-like [Chenopodium quinoa]XP_021721401.1 pheromone-processing carboxypeptidase KEX1-like [Chenopodium quinoa]